MTRLNDVIEVYWNVFAKMYEGDIPLTRTSVVHGAFIGYYTNKYQKQCEEKYPLS